MILGSTTASARVYFVTHTTPPGVLHVLSPKLVPQFIRGSGFWTCVYVKLRMDCARLLMLFYTTPVILLHVFRLGLDVFSYSSIYHHYIISKEEYCH